MNFGARSLGRSLGRGLGGRALAAMVALAAVTSVAVIASAALRGTSSDGAGLAAGRLYSFGLPRGLGGGGGGGGTCSATMAVPKAGILSKLAPAIGIPHYCQSFSLEATELG